MAGVTKETTLAVRGPGGGLPGSGRTPKALQFKNYPKAIKLLDDNVEEALNVLIDGLRSTHMVQRGENNWVEEPDKWFRYNCAIQLLKKAIPDKKIKEITGPEGGPVEVNVNKREAVLNILSILESKSMEELRQEIEDGSFKLSEPDRGREIETEATVEREERKETVGAGSGEGNSSG